MKPSELGAFLRARRARITPDEVGLRSTGHRRVPGLRREEVALLAGVSVDYYTRLEQGRERTPSGAVIDALAAALRVGEDGREHMYRLTGSFPSAPNPVADDRVAPGLLQLMAAWPDNPALVYNRAFDVIASNAIADALFGWHRSRNLMHLVFGEPEARGFHGNWPEVARNAVAGFRLSHGKAPGDPRMRRVLAELLEESPEFTRLWDSHQARGKALEQKTFRHPDTGPLTLTMQTFDVRSNPGQELVVYHAEEGSADGDALRLLGSLAATAGGVD